jgi:hypothetical protein
MEPMVSCIAICSKPAAIALLWVEIIATTAMIVRLAADPRAGCFCRKSAAINISLIASASAPEHQLKSKNMLRIRQFYRRRGVGSATSAASQKLGLLKLPSFRGAGVAREPGTMPKGSTS